MVLVTALGAACQDEVDRRLLPGSGPSLGVPGPGPEEDASDDDGSADGDLDASDDGEGGVIGLGELHGRLLYDCVSCHVGEPPVLTLDEGLLERLLDNSLQQPAMPYVTPGDVEQSYLWHKLAGTHLQIGGYGERMPLMSMFYDSEEMDLVRAWIEGGAKP